MTRHAPRQIDISRVVKGAISAGLTISKIEVDPATGKITLTSGEADTAEIKPASSLAEWRVKRGKA